jgi:nucleoid DNA-binding protein
VKVSNASICWFGAAASSQSMPLTKPDLAAMLLDELEINEREANDMVEGFCEEIVLALASGESVSLAGFGRFENDAFTPSMALTRAVK